VVVAAVVCMADKAEMQMLLSVETAHWVAVVEVDVGKSLPHSEETVVTVM
jgi:hypothetical protein